MQSAPILEARAVSKSFGSVRALEQVSLSVNAGEVHCLLGDNGAGKSTLIKLLSGFIPPDEGAIRVDGHPVRFRSPHDARIRGIATLYQDLAVAPMMSIARNFVIGAEPTRGWGLFRRIDMRASHKIARQQMESIGLRLRNTRQLVGTLSGGEQQSLAIARAEYYGARVLILDEPTSALGVREATSVLRHVLGARRRGLGVILITHNVIHAMPVGDRFTVLSHGKVARTFVRGELSDIEIQRLMGGGEEIARLQEELAELTKASKARET